MAVDVEWVKRCWTGEALRGNGLDDIAFRDVFLELRNVFFVSVLSYVRAVLQVCFDGWLVG